MNIPILYEDNHLLAVTKPVNIPVQQDKSKDPDLLTLLKKDLKIRYQKPGNVYLGLVHRLDRPVGGAMVFAKTSKAASRLARFMQKNQFEREYRAVVHGHLPKKSGQLEHYLWKDRRKNIVHAVNGKVERAKKARLSYQVVSQKERFSLLAVQLHTGRSHQIRVQFATEGHPLYGDQKYGSHINKKGQQLALWSVRLSFPHPTRDEIITVTAPFPSSYPWNLFH